MQYNVELSVVVVNYRTSHLLREQLRILRSELSCMKSEIIVVDNSCSFQEKASLVRLRGCYPEIKFIINRENLGYARACNIGIRNSSGKFIMILNTDVIPLKNSIVELINCLKEKKADVAGPLLFLDIDQDILHPPAQPWDFIHRFIYLVSNRAYRSWWKRYSYRLWRSTKPRKVTSLTGAVLLFRRGVEMFDEELPLYFEDAAFFLTLKKKRKKVYFCPKSKMIHLYNESPSTMKPFFWEISEEIFMAKYFKDWQKNVLRLIEKYNLRSKWEEKDIVLLEKLPAKDQLVEVSPHKDFIPFAYGKIYNKKSFLNRYLKKLWVLYIS